MTPCPLLESFAREAVEDLIERDKNENAFYYTPWSEKAKEWALIRQWLRRASKELWRHNLQAAIGAK